MQMSFALLVGGALLECQIEPRNVVLGAYRCCECAEQNQCHLVESIVLPTLQISGSSRE